jgi:hypothetical protein
MCRIVTCFLLPFLIGATKYAGEFQELGVSGRSCAMGGAGVAQYVEPSVVYFNPAGAYFVQRAILLMHAENFGGIVKNEFASFVMHRGFMALGFGVQYLSVGDIIFTTLSDTTEPPSSDNPPIPYDTVGTRDAVFYISGARGNDWLSYGATIKVFYRDLAVMTGYGGGADILYCRRSYGIMVPGRLSHRRFHSASRLLCRLNRSTPQLPSHVIV